MFFICHFAFSTLRKDSFGVIFQVIWRLDQVQAVNTIILFIPLWVCIFLIFISLFLLIFSFLFLWGRFIMECPGVNLLRLTVKLDSIGALFVIVRVGFVVLVWIMFGALLRVFLKDFEIFQIVPGYMQKACIFHTGLCIARTACEVSLELAIIRPYRGWMVRQMLISFSFWQYWHCRLLLFGYFLEGDNYLYTDSAISVGSKMSYVSF